MQTKNTKIKRKHGNHEDVYTGVLFVPGISCHFCFLSVDTSVGVCSVLIMPVFESTFRFEQPQPKNRQRKRIITWYNPPFNLACTINLGKEFLKLIDKHFPQKTKRKDKLEKIINRHTIKLSYSGTQNMERIIQSHNSKLLREKRKITKPTKICNCQWGIGNFQ